mgnify:CR=1 FL=1
MLKREMYGAIELPQHAAQVKPGRGLLKAAALISLSLVTLALIFHRSRVVPAIAPLDQLQVPAQAASARLAPELLAGERVFPESAHPKTPRDGWTVGARSHVDTPVDLVFAVRMRTELLRDTCLDIANPRSGNYSRWLPRSALAVSRCCLSQVPNPERSARSVWRGALLRRSTCLDHRQSSPSRRRSAAGERAISGRFCGHVPANGGDGGGQQRCRARSGDELRREAARAHAGASRCALCNRTRSPHQAHSLRDESARFHSAQVSRFSCRLLTGLPFCAERRRALPSGCWTLSSISSRTRRQVPQRTAPSPTRCPPRSRRTSISCRASRACRPRASSRVTTRVAAAATANSPLPLQPRPISAPTRMISRCAYSRVRCTDLSALRFTCAQMTTPQLLRDLYNFPNVPAHPLSTVAVTGKQTQLTL